VNDAPNSPMPAPFGRYAIDALSRAQVPVHERKVLATQEQELVVNAGAEPHALSVLTQLGLRTAPAGPELNLPQNRVAFLVAPPHIPLLAPSVMTALEAEVADAIDRHLSSFSDPVTNWRPVRQGNTVILVGVNTQRKTLSRVLEQRYDIAVEVTPFGEHLRASRRVPVEFTP